MNLESASIPGCSEQTERNPPSFVLDAVFITVITLRKIRCLVDDSFKVTVFRCKSRRRGNWKNECRAIILNLGTKCG